MDMTTIGTDMAPAYRAARRQKPRTLSAALARKYSYDRYFQPGGFVNDYYKTQAAKGGFVIISKEDADAIRANLEGE
jgi:hypothetical protein